MKSESNTTRYIPSIEAAKKAGLSGDHVARLCRQGKLTCSLVGKVWYVEERSLLGHTTCQRDASQVRTKELVATRKEEYQRFLEAKEACAPVSWVKSARNTGNSHTQHALGFVGLAEGAVLALVLFASLSFGNAGFVVSDSMHSLVGGMKVMPSIISTSGEVLLARVESAFFLGGNPEASISHTVGGAIRKIAAFFSEDSISYVVSTDPLPVPHSSETDADQNDSGPSSFGVTSLATSGSVPVPTIQVVQGPPQIIERVIERQVGLSANQIESRLQTLSNELKAEIYRVAAASTHALQFSGPAASTPATTQTVALTNKIDSLDGITLSNVTFSSGTSISGLDYLPLAGGTLTGALDSTSTATSTFANGIALTGGCFSVNGTCLTAGGSSNFGQAWELYGSAGYLAPTSTTGVIVAASSTIGAGGQATGLTIAGGATTTGNAYFGGNVGIGTTSPGWGLSIVGSGYATNFFDTSGTTGGYKIDNNLILQASSTNFATLLGYQAGNVMKADGTNNTALGYQALKSITTGDYNTAVGSGALNASGVDTETDLVAIGYNAAQTSLGSYSIAIGSNAVDYNVPAGSIGIGYQTLSGTGNLTGSGVGYVAIGYQAGRGISQSLGGSVYLGYQAGLASTFTAASSYNTLLGHQAGYQTTSDGGDGATQDNTLVGYQSGGSGSLYGGSFNTTLGSRAGYGLVSGARNTLLGYNAGYGLTTGSNNILIGATSSPNLTTGSGNIVIGFNINATSSTATNSLNIGNLLFGTGLDGTGSTISSGNVGIGTSTPYAKLSVVGETVAEHFTATSTTAVSSFQQLLANASTTLQNFTAVNATTSNATTTNLYVSGTASTSALISNTATTTSFGITGLLSSLLKTAADGSVTAAVAGTDYADFSYLFPSNATTTGLGLYASTTIGAGTQTGGLTISGGATTTGSAYVEGNVGIGKVSATEKLHVYTNDGSQYGLKIETGSGSQPGITLVDGAGTPNRWLIRSGVVSSTDGIFNVYDLTRSATRFAIDTSGNVGIGTTTPWRKLSVTDTSAQAVLAYDTTRYTTFSTDSVGDLTIDAQGGDVYLLDENLFVCTGGACPSGEPTGTGNLIVENTISIGTTSPELNIHIVDTTDPAGLLFDAVGTVAANFIGRRANGTLDSRTAAALNDNLLVLGGRGYGTTGYSSSNKAAINFKAAETWTDSAQGTYITLETSATGGTTRSERVRISSSGNVGVGSTTPFAKLSIGSDGSIVTTEKSLSDGATVAIDWSQGNQQKVTLGGNREVTFSNYIAGATLRLLLCQDGTGSRTITWPAAVLWADGSAPTLTTTANKCDVMTFLATEATSTLKIFGSSVLNF